MHLRLESYRLALALISLLWAGSRLHADSTSSAYTLELPCQANLATPAWLGHPVSPVGTFASLALPLTPPSAGAALLVTLTFHEKEGGFLRITWKGAAGEQLLSANFYDGVGMDNQRTLLVPPSVLGSAGTLNLQCGDSVLGVEEIHLEWLEERPAFLSPEQIGEEVVTALGKASSSLLLDGQPAGNTQATLDGEMVTVPLTSSAQRIEQGVEFSLQLEGAPQAARLTFAESGLGWKQHLVLWINQQRAGIITPAVPDLRDAGFTPGSGKTYVGWRDGSIYLPVALLKAGANALQISAEDDDPDLTDTAAADASEAQPLAVNHLSCQFDYTTQAAPPNAASPGIAPIAATVPTLLAVPAPSTAATP